ncbi:hypothetical protein ACFYNL_33980 [Streptomyces sp. NPDC007808]|uniref:hypothetical protein n=1 Tax=Streptomyces sp. NPDC007808 TaxID=3364779 RepID=UPI0036B39DAA
MVRVETVDGKLLVTGEQRVCTRCVLPESFPGIAFGESGVCSYCLDEGERIDNSRSVLDAALGKATGAEWDDRSYDCVLLYSGGKDSSLALVSLARDHGLRVLAMTLDNGFLAQATTHNMRAVVDAVGADHLLFRPHRKLMSGVYRTAMTTEMGPETIKYSTAACGSCIGLVFSVGIQIASAHRVPLLAGGWTPGQMTTSAFVPTSFLREVADRNLDPVKLADPQLGPGLDLWTGPTVNEPLGLINPLYATDYTEAGALEQLREFGWVPPKETDSCSTNCRLNSLLIVDHINRHGFHPYVYEMAHHVRLGALGRDEALAKLGDLGVAPATVSAVSVELGMPTLRISD